MNTAPHARDDMRNLKCFVENSESFVNTNVQSSKKNKFAVCSYKRECLCVCCVRYVCCVPTVLISTYIRLLIYQLCIILKTVLKHILCDRYNNKI